MSILFPVKHQQEGVSLASFSHTSGIFVLKLQKLCKAGRILGARKHPLTRKWWIYPPAKLVTGWMV